MNLADTMIMGYRPKTYPFMMQKRHNLDFLLANVEERIAVFDFTVDPGNTNLLSQKYKTLQQDIKATKEKLDTLKEAAKQADQHHWDLPAVVDSRCLFLLRWVLFVLCLIIPRFNLRVRDLWQTGKDMSYKKLLTRHPL